LGGSLAWHQITGSLDAGLSGREVVRKFEKRVAGGAESGQKEPGSWWRRSGIHDEPILFESFAKAFFPFVMIFLNVDMYPARDSEFGVKV